MCCFCALPSAPHHQDTSSRRCSSQTGRTTVGATPQTHSHPQTCSERRQHVSSTPVWSLVTLLCRHSPGSPSAPPWNPPHTSAAGRCDLLEDTRMGPAGQTYICPIPAESTTDGLWSCDLTGESSEHTHTHTHVFDSFGFHTFSRENLFLPMDSRVSLWDPTSTKLLVRTALGPPGLATTTDERISSALLHTSIHLDYISVKIITFTRAEARIQSLTCIS